MEAMMEQQEKQMKLQPVKKKRMNVQGFVNSPYLFAFIPLLLGGFYLLTHPQYIALGMNNPYAVAFVLSLPVAAFAIKLVINFFSVIEQWIRLQFEKARGSKKGWFFELVICVFMFVSICEAGPFFNDIQHNMLAGALGYITVLAFDLIAVVCIDSRRKELAKGGTKAGIYLMGVIICALVSMTANLYSALQNFHVPADPTIPSLLKSIAPYVGIMFPVMIVFLAFSRDADIEVDDAETYRKQQQKRVDFLVVRREILAVVTREMEQIGLLQQREFILKSILFTRKKMNLVVEIVTGKVEQEISTMKRELEAKEQTIHRQFLAMQQMLEQSQNQQQMVAFQLTQISQFQQNMETSYGDLQSSIVSMSQQRVQLDYALIAEQILPLLPAPTLPNYQQIALNIESKLQLRMEAFMVAQAKEIATLKRAQKTEAKKERITVPLDAQVDSNSENGNEYPVMEDGNLETSFDAMLEEISREESVVVGGPSTDPEMEIIGGGNNQLDGSAETQMVPVINIMTRRKSLTILEVATIIGRTERRVRDLCNEGKLERDEQDKKLIKAVSVRSYLAGREVKVS
jgi:hypothetical protein